GKEKAPYSVHKDILTQECPFFAKMFESGMVEEQTNQVKLPEDNNEAFRQFISWIYFESIPLIDRDNLPLVLECWILAEKFGMTHWQECITFEINAHWDYRGMLTRDVVWVLDNVSHTSDLYKLAINQFAREVAGTSENFKNGEAIREELEQVLARENFPVIDF